jgi:hypothetical protein
MTPTHVLVPVEPDTLALLIRAAQFLDGAAGMELEIEGDSALEIVEALHAQIVEDSDRCFHEDVVLLLAAAPRAPDDADALVERLRAVIEIAHRDSNLVDSQFSVTTEDYRATEAERDEAQAVLELVATRLSAEQIAENANCPSAREKVLEEPLAKVRGSLTWIIERCEALRMSADDWFELSEIAASAAEASALLDAKEG